MQGCTPLKNIILFAWLFFAPWLICVAGKLLMKRSASQFNGVPNKRQRADCSISELKPIQKSCMESNSDGATGLLCGAEDCDSCFARSVASHHRVASFLAANPLENVFGVSKTSHSTYSWQCFDCENVFKATCFIVMLDTWCPKCSRKVQNSQKEIWSLKTIKNEARSSTSLLREYKKSGTLFNLTLKGIRLSTGDVFRCWPFLSSQTL